VYGSILQNYSHGKNLTLLSPLLEEVILRRVLSQEIHHLASSHPRVIHSHPFTKSHAAGGTSRFYMKVKRAGEGRQVARQARKKMAGRQAGRGEMCVTVHLELCCVCDGGCGVAHPASVIATVCPRDAAYA